MAIRNYLMKNKKKSSCIAIALLVCIISFFVFSYVDSTKAGVFVLDEEGNRVQTHDIQVLEIVAEYGQQVLGYTVEGQEPITVEKIESYVATEPIDIDDFKDATGYVLQQIDNPDGTYSYKVTSSLLNKTFNENVLGDSMSTGEITVKVVRASDLTLKDINNANLIFINSNDYNDNLMYYYDQIMNNGIAGYVKGDRGHTYNQTYISNELASAISMKNICAAAGSTQLAGKLTYKDFVYAGISNVRECNIDRYIAKIAEAEVESLEGDTDEATLDNITAVVADVNTTVTAEADSYIRSMAGRTFTADDIEIMKVKFEQGGYIDYNPANIYKYCNTLSAYTGGIPTTIDVFVTNTNGNATIDALNQLYAYKETFNASGSDFSTVTADDYVALEGYLDSIVTVGVVSSVKDDYIVAILDEATVITDPASDRNAAVTDIKNVISDVNAQKKETILTELADAAGNTDLMDVFVNNAEGNFELMDIEGYNELYFDRYVEALKNIEDVDIFKTDDIYDITKINDFFKAVTDIPLTVEVEFTADLSWKAARGIYEYALGDSKALMYNTELLLKNELGDYTMDLAGVDDIRGIDNTNNMYKLLLMMRQLRYSYVSANIMDNIDDMGVYYPNGKDAEGNYIGEGVQSWWKETFGNDFTNYAKYHEPDVVGQTYDENGVAGNTSEYVHERTYSYTGSQFFGGKNFVATNLGSGVGGSTGVVTAGAKYSDGTMEGMVDGQTYDAAENWIFLDTGLNGLNWSNAHVYFFNQTTGANSGIIPMTVHDSTKGQFRIQVPSGYDYVIFTKTNNWDVQTVDIPLYNTGETSYDGKVFYLLNQTYGGKYLTSTVASRPVYYGFCTQSVRDMNPSYSTASPVVNFNGKAATHFLGYGITNASYRIGASINGGSTFTWSSSLPLTLGGWIEFGENYPVGTIFRVEISTDTYPGSAAVNYYYNYRKTGDSSNIEITNFASGSFVEYYGSMNVDVSYKNAASVQYSVDGGAYTDVASGTSLSFGADLSEGTSTTISVKYNLNGTEKTVSTTLYKKEVIYSTTNTNYLALTTATVAGGMAYDATLSDQVNSILVNGNKGDIIRYIMNVTLDEVILPIRVLEVQPGASVSELNTYEGAMRILSYLNVDAADLNITSANYKDSIQVTSMGVREFNTQNEDLTACYDLIYFGIDSGYQVVNNYSLNGKSFYRTKYNDRGMSGYVYYGIGDVYSIVQYLAGTSATDYKEATGTMNNATMLKEFGYWKKYTFSGLMGNPDPSWNLDYNKNYYLKTGNKNTRLIGNDITVKKMEELLDYLKAGYPILLADEIMYCDSDEYIDPSPMDNINDAGTAAKWRYVDKNSKMYAFVQEAKNLGKNAAGVYTGLDSEGNQIFEDGKTYPSLVAVKYAKSGKNPDNLNDMHKLEGGLSFAYKRISMVEFVLRDRPTEYNNIYTYDAVNDKVINTTVSQAVHSERVIAKSSPEYRTYTFKLDIKTNITAEQMENDYEYQVYIDKSGVGKFEESSLIKLDPTVEYVTDASGRATQAVLTGNWPGNIEGFIPWKVMAYRKDNPGIRYVYKGCSVFEMLTGAKDVYVLWVRHMHGSGLTLNLTNSLKNPALGGVITDYNIHLLSVSYSEFLDVWNWKANPNHGACALRASGYCETCREYRANGYHSDYNNDTVYTADNTVLTVADFADYFRHKGWGLDSSSPTYNGYLYNVTPDIANVDSEFNMVVFGFSDSYSTLDISSIMALKNIEYFVESGHSLLYTHDNSSYLPTLNYYQSNGVRISGGTSYWGRYSTAFMREMLGMDIYGISTSSGTLTDTNLGSVSLSSMPNGERILTLTESAANARKYLNEYRETPLPQDAYRGISDVCVFHYAAGYNKLYSETIHGTSAKRIDNWQHTNEVRKVNQGQITEYPFVLSEHIPTALTHTQYMLLDLEDADTTVWYTLNENTVSPHHSCSNRNEDLYYRYTDGDGSNDYYIYSNGNITYTGSGHAGGITTSEQQLFINTIVAALKAGNYAPEVQFTNSYRKTETVAGQEVVKNYIDFYPTSPNYSGVLVSFKPIDYDYEDGATNAFTRCKIYVDIDGDEKYTDGVDVLLNDTDTREGYANYSQYIRNAANTEDLLINPSDFINRQSYSFFIPKDVVENVLIPAGATGGSSGTTVDYSTYSIRVEVGDAGTKKQPTAVAVGGASVILHASQYIEPDQFKLN